MPNPVTTDAAGRIDLHVHFVPGIDDGARTLDDALKMLEVLEKLGYAHVVATPHIRPVMFPNEPDPLRAAFATVQQAYQGPCTLGLAAEHFFDDQFAARVAANATLPLPGTSVVLIEFPYDRWPIRIEDQLFALQARGVTPMLAHPERYVALYDESSRVEKLFDLGVLAQLDLMSVVGKYGQKPRDAALRLLDEGLYDVACTDMHKAGDAETLEKAFEVLRGCVGVAGVKELTSDNPRDLLAGTYP